MRRRHTVVLQVFDFVEEQIGGLFLLVSVSLVFLQIVLRAVFGIGLGGVYETATFCAIWSVIFTAAVGVKRNVHVRVDILIMMVPRPIAFALEIFVTLLMIAVSIALVISGWLLIEESWILGDTTLGSVRIPMWIPQLIMPVGGLLLILRCLERFYRLIRQGPAGFRANADALPTG